MRALDSQTLSTTATCFQYDGDGRRTGLKIRSSQEGVGSSPTFGSCAIPMRSALSSRLVALQNEARCFLSSGTRDRIWTHLPHLIEATIYNA